MLADGSAGAAGAAATAASPAAAAAPVPAASDPAADADAAPPVRAAVEIQTAHCCCSACHICADRTVRTNAGLYSVTGLFDLGSAWTAGFCKPCTDQPGGHGRSPHRMRRHRGAAAARPALEGPLHQVGFDGKEFVASVSSIIELLLKRIQWLHVLQRYPCRRQVPLWRSAVLSAYQCQK